MATLTTFQWLQKSDFCVNPIVTYNRNNNSASSEAVKMQVGWYRNIRP